MARQPEGPPPPPVVQRVRLRYAKRGRLRFTSHRDIARAFERALRRARVPMAYSAGFNPHPRVSWLGASPTGVASEAEYVELALAERVEPDALRAAIDAALPPGLDILEVVEAGAGSLAERIDASSWRIELPGVPGEALAAAVEAFRAASEVPVERLTKNGRRSLDARGPVVRAEVVRDDLGALRTESAEPCAILDLVVQHVTPAVRPDDVLNGLRVVADLVPPMPPRATRLEQGALTAEGRLTDPLAADRDRGVTGVPPS
ncbi:MAG TPA: TIGR03936 family radical SAM-associated protein [Mycobacteriales bacterium]